VIRNEFGIIFDLVELMRSVVLVSLHRRRLWLLVRTRMCVSVHPRNGEGQPRPRFTGADTWA